VAHGYPDYGAAQAISTLYRVLDMAELAARLNALPSLDRRGSIVFHDSFACGFGAWVGGVTASGDKVDLNYGSGFSDSVCINFINAADATSDCELEHWFPYPVHSRMGVEFAWASDAMLGNFELWIELYRTVGGLRAKLKVERDTKKVYI